MQHLTSNTVLGKKSTVFIVEADNPKVSAINFPHCCLARHTVSKLCLNIVTVFSKAVCPRN